MSETTAEITPYELIGGEARVRALVDRFYDLMDLAPQFATLRAMHPAHLDGSRDKLFWFLCGWLGGPAYYMEKVGHPMLRARHLPFPIDYEARDQWLACMYSALEQLEVPQPLRHKLEQSFLGTADWMRNKEG